MTDSRTHALWSSVEGMRIWRSPESDFYRDEVGNAPAVYTDDVLRAIAGAGFNAIWVRGKLGLMMDSAVFPELNEPQAGRRRAGMADLIARADRLGVGVYLFFNEPLALPEDHPFWRTHADVRGQAHRDYGEMRDSVALCTSSPAVQRYLRDAVDSVLRDLPGLRGVILITATEYFTHCWSHHARFPLNDGVNPTTPRSMMCRRCLKREPADIVGELVTIWRDAAAAVTPSPRVLCWNWSWSQWYPDPQTEVFERLPQGIQMMLDFERGTQVVRDGRALPVDEYSLSVAGPSERFVLSKREADRRRLPVNAKMQLGTTHEIATVPNLPLMERLHAKLVRLTQQGVVGIMGTWNFGCSLTLNTAAVGLYCEDPTRYADARLFLSTLADRYLGVTEADDLLLGWKRFGEAFEHYPFSIRFLYVSPLNESPAYPLIPRYEDTPLGGSWVEHGYGDRLDDALTPGFSAAETADAFAALADAWDEGLRLMERAFDAGSADATQRRHRQKERSCARMIGTQMRCTSNIFRFHAWRQRRIAELGLRAPCDVPLDETGRAILKSELSLTEKARDLCAADPRLGLHQECHAYFYNAEKIGGKIEGLRSCLSDARRGVGI